MKERGTPSGREEGMPTEVSCKGNGFTVKVKSTEPLAEVVAAVTKLTRLQGAEGSAECRAPGAGTGSAGGRVPGAGGRGEKAEGRMQKAEGSAGGRGVGAGGSGKAEGGVQKAGGMAGGRGAGAARRGEGEEGAGRAGRPPVEARIEDEYRLVEVEGRVIDFRRKRKRREFVKFLHLRRIETGQAEFRYALIRVEFLEKTGISIESDRFEEDFFRGQAREFRLLFQLVDERRGIYRIRI